MFAVFQLTRLRKYSFACLLASFALTSGSTFAGGPDPSLEDERPTEKYQGIRQERVSIQEILGNLDRPLARPTQNDEVGTDQDNRAFTFPENWSRFDRYESETDILAELVRREENGRMSSLYRSIDVPLAHLHRRELSQAISNLRAERTVSFIPRESILDLPLELVRRLSFLPYLPNWRDGTILGGALVFGKEGVLLYDRATADWDFKKFARDAHGQVVSRDKNPVEWGLAKDLGNFTFGYSSSVLGYSLSQTVRYNGLGDFLANRTGVIKTAFNSRAYYPRLREDVEVTLPNGTKVVLPRGTDVAGPPTSRQFETSQLSFYLAALRRDNPWTGPRYGEDEDHVVNIIKAAYDLNQRRSVVSGILIWNELVIVTAPGSQDWQSSLPRYQMGPSRALHFLQ